MVTKSTRILAIAAALTLPINALLTQAAFAIDPFQIFERVVDRAIDYSRQNNNSNNQNNSNDRIRSFLMQNGLTPTDCVVGAVAIWLPTSNDAIGQQVCAMPTSTYPSGTYRLDPSTGRIVSTTPGIPGRPEGPNTTSTGYPPPPQDPAMVFLMQNGLTPTQCMPGAVVVSMPSTNPYDPTSRQVCAMPVPGLYPAGYYRLEAGRIVPLQAVYPPPLVPPTETVIYRQNPQPNVSARINSILSSQGLAEAPCTVSPVVRVTFNGMYSVCAFPNSAYPPGNYTMTIPGL